MNRIYKVVWSKARNCYVVASELAKRHTKGCGTRSLGRAAVTLGIVAGLTVGMSGNAWAGYKTVYWNETNKSLYPDVAGSVDPIGSILLGDYTNPADLTVTGMSNLNGGITVDVGTIAEPNIVFKVDEAGNTTIGRAPNTTTTPADPGRTANLTVNGKITATGAISGENITRETDPGTPVTTEINRTVDTEANTTTTTMETTTIKTDTTTIEGVMSVTHEHKEVYTTTSVYAGEHPTVDLDPSDATSSTSTDPTLTDTAYSVNIGSSNNPAGVDVNLNVYGEAKITGDLTVGIAPDPNVEGDLGSPANLVVTGATTTNGITNTGDVKTDTLTTTGATKLATDGSATAVGGTLAVAGDTTIGDNFKVTASDGSLSAAGEKFKVDANGGVNAAKGNFTVDAAGNTAAKGTLTVDKAATLKSTLSVAGDTTVGGDLTVTGTVTGATLTDGTAELTAGKLTGALAVDAVLVSGGTLTDGTAKLTGGNLTTTGTVEAGTLTDGTAKLTGGNLTTTGTTAKLTGGNLTTTGTVEAGTLTDGTAKLTGGNLTTTGTVTAGTVTDGTATMTGGDLTGARNITASATIRGKDLKATGTLEVASTSHLVGDVTMDANASVGGNLDVAGNFAVNTNKFTVDSATGDLVSNSGTTTFNATSKITNKVGNNSKIELTDGKVNIDATKTIFNEGSTNQVMIDSTGIRIGLHSGQVDDEGFYAGGHTWSEAKAAFGADGRIKGADGAFIVETDGAVTAKSYSVDGKTYIDSKGLNANDQKIRNMAPGEIGPGSAEAVTGGQVYSMRENLQSDINRVGAGAAAMSNLRPVDMGNKFSMAMGVGNYRDKTAMALGMFYKPSDQVMLNMSGTVGSGHNMIGAGISFALDKVVKPTGSTVAASSAQVVRLEEENKAIKAELAELKAAIKALQKQK